MGPGINSIMDFFTCQWRAPNDKNFLGAPCYKLMTCDPEDDIIDYYSSLMCGVAVRLAEQQLAARQPQPDLEAARAPPPGTPWHKHVPARLEKPS